MEFGHRVRDQHLRLVDTTQPDEGDPRLGVGDRDIGHPGELETANAGRDERHALAGGHQADDGGVLGGLDGRSVDHVVTGEERPQFGVK